MMHQSGEWDHDQDEHRSRHSVHFHRGHLIAYDPDKNGRRRWDFQTVYGHAYADVEVMMPSGFGTAPKTGDNVECFAIDMYGDHSHLVVFPLGDANNQFKPAPGEAVVYQPENPANFARFKADGTLEVTTDSPVSITSRSKTIDVTAKGNVSLTTNADANVKADGNLNATVGKSLKASVNDDADVTAGANINFAAPTISFKADTFNITAFINHIGNMKTVGQHIDNNGKHS